MVATPRKLSQSAAHRMKTCRWNSARGLPVVWRGQLLDDVMDLDQPFFICRC